MSLQRRYEENGPAAGRGFEAVLSAQALAELMLLQPGTRLLDVRTPGEYETVHIAGAYNVPLDNLAEHAAEIARVREPIVLVCQSGARARRAEAALRQSNLENLHVLEGGMNGWLAANQPVRRGASRISLERQVRIAAGALAALGGLLALALNPLFALLPAAVGSGLVFAGVTDKCGLALVLARLPYNRPASCDVEAMVRALKVGVAPVGVQRSARVSASVRSCAS